jgi:superfamily II DNA or RNA helicase
MITATGPEQFLELNLSLPEIETCLDAPGYDHYYNRLKKLVTQEESLALRPPFDYQQIVAPLFALRPHGLAAYSMGTGKSMISCLVIHMLYNHCLEKLRPGTIQILTRKSLVKTVWAKELVLAGLGDYFEVIRSEKDLRSATKPILLYHYDLLCTQSKHGRLMLRKGLKGEPMWKVWRHIAQPAFLVMDEVHLCREGTDRTKAVKELAKHAKRRMGLTGTPMDSLVSHLATVFGIIYGENSVAFPFTKLSFTKQFTHQQTSNLSWATGETQSQTRKVAGVLPSQIPGFWRATRCLMHRLTYTDPIVATSKGLKFPDQESVLVTIPMAPPHKALYEQSWRSSEAELQEIFTGLKLGGLNLSVARAKALSRVNILRQVSSAPWMVAKHITNTAKIDKLIELATKHWLGEGRKGIVFTSMVGTGKAICQGLAKAGIKAVRVYAQDPADTPKTLGQEARDERIEAFQEDEDIGVLVINQQLGSEGLNLVEASWICYYDHPWSSLLVDQGNARCKRPGQTEPIVHIYHFAHEKTVDAYVVKLLERKARNNAVYVDFNFSASLWGSDSAVPQGSNVDVLDIVASMGDELTA